MIWWLLLIAIGINLAGFCIAYTPKSDKLTDFSYGLTFLILAVAAFVHKNGRSNLQWLALLMVSLWGLRIGTFLLIRILRNKKDSRFDGIRENFWKFLQFWFFQGVTAWLILLPTFFLFERPADNLGVVGLIGLIVWAAGLSFETIADWQKFKFSSNPRNKGRWISSGLWAYSRHPNYFGEILNWAGIYLFCVPFIAFNQKLIGLISPLYIAGLLIFVTGIPKLEEYADTKWGSDPDYKKYKKGTPVLVPFLK